MVLAILSRAEEPVPVQEISERLWPGDDSAGHTARTRRSRLLNALREKAGDLVATGEEGWTLNSPVFSDFRTVLEALGRDPQGNEEEIIAACDRIDVPLAGSTQWAQDRDTMAEQLRNALQSAKEQAIGSEAYDVAKAVKRAEEKAGGLSNGRRNPEGTPEETIGTEEDASLLERLRTKRATKERNSYTKKSEEKQDTVAGKRPSTSAPGCPTGESRCLGRRCIRHTCRNPSRLRTFSTRPSRWPKLSSKKTTRKINRLESMHGAISVHG